MNLSIINLLKELPDEVKKLVSVLEPENVYIGKRDNKIEDFCYWQHIPLKVLGTKQSLFCQKCEEVILNGDIAIICGRGYEDLFSYSIDFCKDNRKNFMVIFNE